MYLFLIPILGLWLSLLVAQHGEEEVEVIETDMIAMTAVVVVVVATMTSK